MSAGTISFDALVGQPLSAVTFVHDYWQLAFDGLTVNILTRIEVGTAGARVKDGDDQFRNRLCGQIGKCVDQVVVAKDNALTLAFEGGSSIVISLRPDDYRGPEAVVLHAGDRNSFLAVRNDG